MEILDAPVKLIYDHKNNFPITFVYSSYIFLLFGIFSIVGGLYIIGICLILIALFGITNRFKIVIDPDKNLLHEYNQFLGFLKYGKKYPLNKFKYISNLPLVDSHKVYAFSTFSTTVSKKLTTVTLFGEGLKGKITIASYESYNEALENGEQLADRLKMKHFEYDPILVREVLLGQRTL